MIPRAYIDAWRQEAPWQQDSQVEQDLVLSRALVAVFSNDVLRDNLTFRGGTAIHKLFFDSQPRYSEDIDLVQLKPGPIGAVLDEMAEVFEFLGTRDDRTLAQKEHNNTITYQFDTELPPPPQLKIKIEINTREHFHVMDLKKINFEVSNRWFQGQTEVVTYQLEELLGTKLRALYQRSKGRDLFDLYHVMSQCEVNTAQVIHCYYRYMEESGFEPPSRAEFEQNLEAKMQDPEFTGDTTALLRPGVQYNFKNAYQFIEQMLIQDM